jgi:hypothetical protein
VQEFKAARSCHGQDCGGQRLTWAVGKGPGAVVTGVFGTVSRKQSLNDWHARGQWPQRAQCPFPVFQPGLQERNLSPSCCRGTHSLSGPGSLLSRVGNQSAEGYSAQLFPLVLSHSLPIMRRGLPPPSCVWTVTVSEHRGGYETSR